MQEQHYSNDSELLRNTRHTFSLSYPHKIHKSRTNIKLSYRLPNSIMMLTAI